MKKRYSPYVRAVSTRDFAYGEIKKQIVIGELAPEEPIVEEHLAKKLDISRTPLREALQRLEIEEFVVRQTNGRLKVAPISIQEVEEIFTIRSMLEGIVVEQATKNATEKDIRHLQHMTNIFEKTYKVGDLDEILYYGEQFHTYIYELSGNKTAIKMLYQLNDHVHRYRRFVPWKTMRQPNSITDHKQIVQQISQQDEIGAKKAMEDHIIQSLRVVIRALRSIGVRTN